MTNIYPPGSIILAPLSGYTDLPYRRSARRGGCRYAFTEMIDACSLAYRNDKTHLMLDRGNDEEWLGVQLVGAKADKIAEAVEVINSHDFNVLDFNLGCPVAKVAKKCAGAALGARPEDAARVFEIIAAKSRFPVTAKIRILDETNPEPTLYLVKLLEQAGAQAITVHGRIRSAFYSGPVFTDIIRAIRESVNIQVIANGGIMIKPACDELKQKSGCDCVMVARGAMGNPWLFRELSDAETYRPPCGLELAEEMRLHIMEMAEYYGETLGMKISRKVILDYLHGRGYHKSLKNDASFLKTTADFLNFLEPVKEGPSSRLSTADMIPLPERIMRPNPEE